MQRDREKEREREREKEGEGERESEREAEREAERKRMLPFVTQLPQHPVDIAENNFLQRHIADHLFIRGYYESAQLLLQQIEQNDTTTNLSYDNVDNGEAALDDVTSLSLKEVYAEAQEVSAS